MSRVLSLVLASLLAVFLIGAPAQAGPRSPDPELVQPAARTSVRAPEKALPAIDSDVYVYALTPSIRSYFVVAGHLLLAPKSGSSTQWSGSLVDYVGNKSYKASADTSNPTAPTLKIASKNGTFTFKMDQYFGSGFYSGTTLTKPSKLKVPLAQIALYASAHTTNTASYHFVLSERSGSIYNPIEYAGTLTIVYDSNQRISGGQVTVTNTKGKNVTHALKSSGFYNTGYFYTVAQVDKKYFGLTATVTGTSFSGYGFGTDGSKTTQWVINGTV